MKNVPSFSSTLVRILRRDGCFAFLGKCVRYGFSPEAWRWLARKGTNVKWIPYRPAAAAPDPTPAEREESLRILRDYSPKTSVVVASFNDGPVLRRTLDSLLAQTYRNVEVLVADDGSSDDSAAIIREYAEKRPDVFPLRHKGGVHKGLPATVKLAVEASTGEFVAFCEPGDVWTPDHLEKKVGLLRETRGEPDFIVNEVDMAGEEWQIRETVALSATKRPVLGRMRNRIAPEAFREHNWFFTFSMCMVRRSVLEACDFLSVPRPENLGWWLWRQICFARDVWCVHEKLTKWRLPDDAMAFRQDAAQNLADIGDLTAKMDRMLYERDPARGKALRPFLRPEDAFSCPDGVLRDGNAVLAGPRFSVFLPLFGSPARRRRTLESLASQTYADAEILLVGRERDLPSQEELDLLFRRRIPRTAVRHVPCRFVDIHAMSEAALPAASGEWVALVLPGDQMRPEALQTFAARILLQPEADAFWAVSRCRESGMVVGPPPKPKAKPVPLVPPGAFVLRRKVAVPSGVGLPGFPELDLLARACAGGRPVFVDHEVLIHDDSPEGGDPFGKRVFDAAKALARLRGSSAPPRFPVDTDADVSLVRRSSHFDACWYLRENPDVRRAGVSAAHHYARYGTTPNRNPSPDFTGDEYLAVNPDVGYAKVHPLIHYERHGRTEGRLVSFLENDREVSFPAGAVPLRKAFPAVPRGKGRTAVFAGFFSDGRVPETDLMYLKGLREVADNVVYVCNNPVFPEELHKLGGIASGAIFEAHGDYDFGSYKRGWFWAKEHGLLGADVCDEAVFANSSCYGPVFSFAGTFAEMARRSCDFWGLAACRVLGRDHLQSYFFVVRRRVLDGPELDAFLASVERQPTRGHVVMRYEFQWTKRLVDAGYSFDSLVPIPFQKKTGVVPSRMPVTTMERFRFPLLKVKSVNGDCRESIDRALEIVRENHPALAERIVRGTMDRERVLVSPEAHRASFAGKAARIAAKAASGRPLRAVFLVSSPSMFPARPLFDAMRADAAFDAKLFVVPDLRGLLADPDARRAACRAELVQTYPEVCFLDAEPDEFGLWPDVLADADIVCHPSPYSLSCFRFNPHYALGRDFLPIHVNYGFYRSKYDRDIMGTQNYDCFWKAFFECGATAREYEEHSVCRGENADVVGYVKMDALATAEPWSRNGNRKRVLIAPHHSVEGGANDTLSLSNFQRYADFFLALPGRHPELDFVFRPHPFLFTVLAKPDKWGKAKVDAWIARMKAHPNVRWSEDGDYFPAFASCDAIVQDCGSYLVEWFYTGKPCCYMLKEPADIDAKFAPLGRECLSHCHIAYSEADIEAFLRDVVEGGIDSKAAGREAFRKEIMVNYPHAAEAALASIKQALGMK